MDGRLMIVTCVSPFKQGMVLFTSSVHVADQVEDFLLRQPIEDSLRHDRNVRFFSTLDFVDIDDRWQIGSKGIRENLDCVARLFQDLAGDGLAAVESEAVRLEFLVDADGGLQHVP